MAGIAGGLGGAVGIAAESTYGTFVSPTRALEVRSAKLQEVPHIAQGTGLAYGRTVDLGSRRVPMWYDAKGDVNMEFLNSGMALLLKNIMGSNASLTQVGSTPAYQIACNYGVPDGQNYMTLQNLVPDTGGNIHCETFHGCKITKATFSIDLQNPLMLDLSIDSQYKEEASAAFTPSYTASTAIFTAFGMQFKAGARGSEVFVDGVRKFSFSIERILKVDRIYVGGSYKDEPTTSGVTKITGSMDVDLLPTNKAVLWDLMHTQLPVPSIVAQFTGPQIGTSGQYNMLTLNPCECFIDSGGTPELAGPDIVTATLAFSVLTDPSNDSPLSATLVTADSTL
ncbi:MAG: hypothetical protein JO130_18585 [Solirubrobacterales bacterium]|nr:hypothetical protein [Solirubrobacterales bacterium]